MNGSQLMFLSNGSTKVRINEKYQDRYGDAGGVFCLVGYSVRQRIVNGLRETVWHGIISRTPADENTESIPAEQLDLAEV